MGLTHGLSKASAPGGARRLIALLMALMFLAACPPASQKEEELRKEIQDIKAQVASLQEKVNQLQGGQQAMIEMLRQPTAPRPLEPMDLPAPLQGTETLTVGQLLASKDKYLGARVTVKGVVGPVMMHHKSLMLKSPQGMVEILFGNLPDPKLVQTLSSTPLNKPLTVTGMVSTSPAKGAASQLQINAEAVEF